MEMSWEHFSVVEKLHGSRITPNISGATTETSQNHTHTDATWDIDPIDVRSELLCTFEVSNERACREERSEFVEFVAETSHEKDVITIRSQDGISSESDTHTRIHNSKQNSGGREAQISDTLRQGASDAS